MHANQFQDHLFALHLLQAACLTDQVDLLIAVFAVKMLVLRFVAWQFAHQAVVSLFAFVSQLAVCAAHQTVIALIHLFAELQFHLVLVIEVVAFQELVQFHLDEYGGSAYLVHFDFRHHT